MPKYSFHYTEEDASMYKQALDSVVESEQDSKIKEFSDLVVRKPWGYEYLVYENDDIAIWMLHIARKRETSTHSHPNKVTNLILLSGNLQCQGLGWTVDLEPLDCVRIEKGVFHKSKTFSSNSIFPPCENGSFLIEIESPVDKDDLVRLRDEYGRKGKSYEGFDSVTHGCRELLQIPSSFQKWKRAMLDVEFSLKTGGDIALKMSKYKQSLFIPIESYDANVTAGEVLEYKNIYPMIDKINRVKFLIINRKKNSMRVSDFVSSFVSGKGVKQIFSVSGGGAMHLVDSFGINPDIEYIATHHEQSAAMAAEAYARISQNIGAALFTTGPGGTNAITGVAGAWIDSIPVMYISGQVTSNTLLPGTGLRQFGIQESDIAELVKSITKYSVVVKDEKDIRYELEKAYHIATSGRPGPVWIDIPLDIQSKQITPDKLRSYEGRVNVQIPDNYIESKIGELIDLIRMSNRPVLIIGNGIRLAHAEQEFLELAEQLKIPIVSSWTASDLLASDLDYYVGRSGIFGDRASNFAVQNADLLIIIGSRMSVPQTGYNFSSFSRESKKVMVDIDKNEIYKPSLSIDLPILSDIKNFLLNLALVKDSINLNPNITKWRETCLSWKEKYPVVLDSYQYQKEFVNSFYFIDRLSNELKEDAVIVTDMGTSFTCTMQTFKVKLGQRLTTSSGHASMGFGLPGAIGACYANNMNRVICISGDGGLQMNIQELQTVAHNNLPITIFVLNNGGYLTIKTMQQNHFGRYVGSEESSGVSCPDMEGISRAYKIPFIKIKNHKELNDNLPEILDSNTPLICEILMSEEQELIPRSSSMKQPDGSIVSKPIEDLYPFLDRDEFRENMIISPLDEI